MKLLIIEDDEDIIEAISLAFQIRWPEARIISTHSGRRGIELVEDEVPDVIILDLGLPDVSGFDVLRQIRKFFRIPILVVTVRGEEANIIKGLEWGADDYIIKPFRQLELLARVKANIRRQQQPGEEIVIGQYKLVTETAQFFKSGKGINLTLTENRILNNLMLNAGHIVTHSNLIEAVWGNDYPGATDSLKVHIRRLRKKIEDDPSRPRLIITKSGIGYSFVK
jgi:two-component system KDP operon response regulator KdpE